VLTPLAVSGVTLWTGSGPLAPGADAAAQSALFVRWVWQPSSIVAAGTVVVLLVGPGITLPVLLGTAAGSAANVSVAPAVAFAGLSVVGNYTVRVLFSASVFADSARVFVDPCSAKLCLAGPGCVNGACFCPPGYSGPVCGTSVCTSSPCLNGGGCTVTGATTRSCNCSAPFSGDSCGTVASCTACVHGYATGCGSCSCSGFWTGDACAACGLAAQCVDSSPNEGCTACACTATGAAGTFCDQLYVTTTWGPLALTLAEAASQPNFGTSVAAAVASALQISAGRVLAQRAQASATPNSVDVVLQLLSARWATYPAGARRRLESTDASLQAVTAGQLSAAKVHRCDAVHRARPLTVAARRI
jgi:hypothetical protein